MMSPAPAGYQRANSGARTLSVGYRLSFSLTLRLASTAPASSAECAASSLSFSVLYLALELYEPGAGVQDLVHHGGLTSPHLASEHVRGQVAQLLFELRYL